MRCKEGRKKTIKNNIYRKKEIIKDWIGGRKERRNIIKENLTEKHTKKMEIGME